MQRRPRVKLITVPWELDVPTLTLASLAAVTPARFEIALVDLLRERLHLDEPVDLVGLSASTPAINTAYRIAAAYRARGVKVVIGGHHATAMPEEALEHADAVVCGEGETSWRRICDDFLGAPSRVQGIYRDPAPDLASLPQPRIDLMKIHRYDAWAYPVTASRGCPESCSFCFAKRMTRGYRTFPIAHVIEQIRRRPAFVKSLFFVDDNLPADPDHARELFKELRRLRVPFGMQARHEFAADPDELRRAAEAGCALISSGYESVNQASLDGTGKRADASLYRERIANIFAAGIIPSGNWMFGFDWDTPDAFARTLEVIDSTELLHCSFTAEIPFPGTATYKRYLAEGRILTHDYEQYRGKDCVVFRPKRLSPRQLTEGVRWITRRYYSAARTLQRTRKLLSSPQLLRGAGGGALRAPAMMALNFGQLLWWRGLMSPALEGTRQSWRSLKRHLYPGDWLRGTNYWRAPFAEVPQPEHAFTTESPLLHREGFKRARSAPLVPSSAVDRDEQPG